MDIEIILSSDWNPRQVAEIAVEAEKAGVRTVWQSNITNTWDPFIGLVPAAIATSKILLGVLAVSPYEMHPIKIANSILSLNELANGRAIIGLGGGGAVAMNTVDVLDFKKMRIVRGVREAAEIIHLIASGKFYTGYNGEIFKLTRPSQMTYAKASRPKIYTCSMGPQMIRMGARIADGMQVGDVPPGRMDEVMQDVRAGFAKRQYPADDFRTSNFKTFELPENIKQVILAPDGDDAGQAVIRDAAMRLAGQGREVRAAKLPAGRDWVDVLDDYEERAGILEFEMELSRLDAEIEARQETING